MQSIRKLKSENGAGFLEMVLLLSLIAVIAIPSVGNLSHKTRSVFFLKRCVTELPAGLPREFESLYINTTCPILADMCADGGQLWLCEE